MMHRPWARLSVLFFLAAAAARAGAQEPRADARSVVRVAIVADGPVGDLPLGVEVVEHELRGLARATFDVQFPSELRFVGDWTVSGVRATLDGVYARSDVDLVIAFGFVGSNDVCHRKTLAKPTIALRVVDAKLQEIPFAGPGSGVKNLNYLAAPLNLERDVDAFREVAPFARAVVLLPAWMTAALPELAKSLPLEFDRLGVMQRFVAVAGNAAEALAALPQDTQAVFVAPLPHLVPAAFEAIVGGLNARRLPSFSLLGAEDVRRGLLGANAPETDLVRVARRAAQNAVAILSGKDAGDLATTVAGRERLTINMATARAIGVWPRFEVLTEAELVGEHGPSGVRELTLGGVMREALRVDRELLASEAFLHAAIEDVALARSALRPGVDLAAAWTFLDEDLAVLGRAEKSLSAGVFGSWPLWSEGAWADFDVSGHRFASREHEYETKSLDVALAAARAYLDVLRSQTLERIALEDLELTRSNLELARIRRDLGVSGPAEMHRWDTNVATGRQGVLDARAQKKLAELELNRVLHKPLEEPFSTREVGLDDPLVRIDERIGRYIDNPFTFAVFRDFEVERGLAASPELAGLDDRIRAQERVLLSTERSHWQPVVSLDGALVDVLQADGEGATIPGPLAPFVPDPERSTWSAAAIARFELYSGGAKAARERAARHELIRLRLEREALVERVEQRIRSMLFLASASWAGIRLSDDAARSAAQNLELVTGSYSRGVVSIIELLDAQEASVDADRATAKAVYDFIVDLMEVQRAVGRFDVFASQATREEWLEQVDEYFEEHLSSFELGHGDYAARESGFRRR